MGPFIIGAAIVLVFIILIVSNIVIVQQSRAYVIERLGAFDQVWGVASTSSSPSSSASPVG